MVNKLTSFLFDKSGVPAFGKFLNLTSLRHKLISGNVANVSTPGYRAQDVDFRAELAKISGMSSHLPGLTTHPRHIPTGQHPGKEPDVDRRKVAAGDMNSVDIDQEISRMAQNELLFTIGARLLQLKFEGFRKAITSK